MKPPSRKPSLLDVNVTGCGPGDLEVLPGEP